MTINPTLPPTVDEFRKVFPEFVDVSDEQVQFYLDTAMQWIDTFWYPIDAKLAVMYAAAHYLYLQDQASGGEITGGSCRHHANSQHQAHPPRLIEDENACQDPNQHGTAH